MVRPKNNSPSPAQRTVRADAKGPISNQLLTLFRTVFRRVPIAMAILLYGTISLRAEVKVLRVKPNQTDPAIATVHGPNIAVYDPQAPHRHQLFFFLVGTGGKATGSLRMDTTFAQWGYHAVTIDYEDNVIAVSCAHSLDPTSFGRYRDAIVTGAPVSDKVKVNRANSILNRFQRLLTYLVKNDPKGDWDQFIKDGKPVWSRIIVAGHSQGSGHAAYIGKLFRVDRVLMFSGPQDYMDNLHRPAPWQAMKSATPPSRFFAFLALKDPFNVHHQVANCMMLMHLSKPETLAVKPGEVIRGDFHILINNFPTKHPHGSTLLTQFTNVWKYMVTADAADPPTGLLCDLLEHPAQTVVTRDALEFGWVYHPSFRGDSQTGYRIIVTSKAVLAAAGKGDVWDSGIVSNSASINVPYKGPVLGINRNYYWRVQTMDRDGNLSPLSAAQHFMTGSRTNLWADRYPPRFVAADPVLVTNTAPGRWFIDFGQDAFGYVKARLKGLRGIGVTAVFGEMATNATVIPGPPGSCVRYGATTFTLKEGDVTYAVRPPQDTATINPPPEYGNVMPFRYLELIHYPGTLNRTDVRQERLATMFDPNAASFSSSSSPLDQVWTLCRNSMEWLSFDGIYVDGDRERKPYEADTYIHQMSSYAVNNDFVTPRYSFEYQTTHPTWPTEWKFHMIMIAWEDYLHTGNDDLLRKYYNVLRHDSFIWAATGDGLMRGFPGFPQPQSPNSDVVDWPIADRDGFVGISRHGYRNWTNAVNNAFYYHCLRIMARVADVIGRTNDAATFTANASRVYRSYNSTFWDSRSRSYVDGVGTTHSSAHANFFPMAFGLVPTNRQAAVVRFLHHRIAANGGMPCSVYGAQYLLEALFEAGDTDTALDLMTTNGPRSWMNMIHIGSTLTTEAWSFQDKPNMDLNHAWGAAPGNLIARYVLGLRPLAAGFGRILIQPHLGHTLTFARGVVPTIRGPVSIQATSAPGRFQLRVNIPGNVTATIMLPTDGITRPVAQLDGQIASGSISNHWFIIPHVGSGPHALGLGANAGQSHAASQPHTIDKSR